MRELLSVLSRQTVLFHELLVVDSSSRDQTVTIAKEFGAEVVVIPQKEFDHGGTRTMISRMARGDILIFLTQDAVPVSTDALEKLIQPLLLDEMIAVTYGRQLPNRDATVLAAHLRSFNYPAQAVVRSFADRQQLGFRTVFVSNSFAAYRKTALAEIDYFKSGLIFGEDTCAVGRLLMQGYKVAYVADAMVFHSHNYSCVQEFRRSFDIGVLHVTEKWLLATYGHAEGIGRQYVRSGVSYLFDVKKRALLPNFFWRVVVKFLGYKLGRNFQLLPQWLIPFLSMHRSWWARHRDASASLHLL
ncbi:MAG: glycosyltransferase [Proteobacteria bacterium]|nr:glycosyltransferase [Pseudomonadota bacterium]MBU1650498.1 glycosyltransferase [Pseudomonadota bacterium]